MYINSVVPIMDCKFDTHALRSVPLTLRIISEGLCTVQTKFDQTDRQMRDAIA